MGGLSDELRRGRRLPGPPCSVRIILELLDEEDREALQAALSDRTYSSAGIADVLAGQEGLPEGIVISKWAIQNHRRGDCGCRRLAA